MHLSTEREVASVLDSETVWRNWRRFSEYFSSGEVLSITDVVKSYHENSVLKTFQLEFSVIHSKRSKSCQQINDRVPTSGDPGKTSRALRQTVSAGRTLVLTTLFNKQNKMA